MKTSNLVGIAAFSALVLASTQAYSEPASSPRSNQLSVDEALIFRAKQATAEYKLTTTQTSCLSFKVAAEKYEGHHRVDVFEVHGGQCCGDPSTSPRIFSVVFDDKKGEIWSDAISPVGQMENLGRKKTRQ